MLSDEGRKGVFNTLDEGTDYTLALVMANSFGDTKFVSKAATTFGHFSKDFDQTKNFEDFIGAFNATATVAVSGGSGKTTAKYRIDITRVNDSEVIINGTSDMRDFTPELGAYYDKQKHMLIVEPQSAGTYNGNYAMFTLTDGMSYYWGSGSLAIGYIGDTLYWSASPYAGSNVYGYLFALFSSPVATSSSYLREYVGSKTYSFVSMTPAEDGSCRRRAGKAAATAEASFATVQAGDQDAASGTDEQRRNYPGRKSCPGNDSDKNACRRRQADAHGPRAPHPLSEKCRQPIKPGPRGERGPGFSSKFAKNSASA